MEEQLIDNNPLVSIITPTYNRPEYLKVALESALNQTYRNIEIIVSDNHSPEDPKYIIDEFADPRIRFVRNNSNIGMFANTMQAFHLAKGKYVASLLDDDAWEPTFLENLVSPLESNPDLVLAFSDHYVMDEHGQIDVSKTDHCSQYFKRATLSEGIYHPFSELALVHRAVSPAIAAVIRRSAIDWESIPPEVGGLWDIYMAYLCSRSGAGAYYCPKKLTRYREHSQTETMQSGRRNVAAKIRKGMAEVFVYEKFLADENLEPLRSYFKKKWAHSSVTLGVALLRETPTNLSKARHYFRDSLKTRYSMRALAALVLSFLPPSMIEKF